MIKLTLTLEDAETVEQILRHGHAQEPRLLALADKIRDAQQQIEQDHRERHQVRLARLLERNKIRLERDGSSKS